MQINVNIYTETGTFEKTPTEVAEEILASFNGDPEKDTCIVTFSWIPETGYAGASSMPGMPLPPPSSA